MSELRVQCSPNVSLNAYPLARVAVNVNVCVPSRLSLCVAGVYVIGPADAGATMFGVVGTPSTHCERLTVGPAGATPQGSEVTVISIVIWFGLPSTGVQPVVSPQVCVASLVAVITYVALGATGSTVAGTIT